MENPNNNSYTICSNSNKKSQARNDTIIEIYRSIFGIKSLPAEKQYWTMCNLCSDGSGSILRTSELGQVLESGLITPNQFFGVEKIEWIHKQNVTVEGPNWLCGDFKKMMVEWGNNNTFGPGIINVDDVHMPRRSQTYLAKILSFVDEMKIENVMIVSNNVLKTRHRESKHTEMPQALLLNRFFDETKWNIHEQIYQYQGSNEKNDNFTTMGTMIIWR